MLSHNLLNNLNDEQQKAVMHVNGPAIILAGAGSGKTRVLVFKVLYLITERKIAPHNILMVTFTNKAAGEMKERISHLLSSYQSSISGSAFPTIGTFHSVCARLLRREGKHIGIPINFQIFDEQDQLDAMRQAMEMLDISLKNLRPRSVLNAISQAKNEMLDNAGYAQIARGYFQQTVAKLYPFYQKILKNSDALDFDDLLLETIRLFKKNPEILSHYQDLFTYILIDEYQDTNHAQYELTKLLSAKHRNICVVGDFSQSIYSFRGADFRNLEKFKQDFPESVTFSLSQNYRSTQNILDSATSVISHNITHPVLSLWTNKEKGDDILIFPADNEQHEAEFIIQKVLEEKMKNPNFSFGDVAVLYRMNAQSRVIEEVFLHHSIPYILVGGTRFYARREVKDVLSLLSFLANPKNSIAHRRLEKLGKRRFERFLPFVSEYHSNPHKEDVMTIELLDNVVKAFSYLDLFDENDPEDKSRLENIKELRSVAITFPELHAFLENVALVEQEYLPDTNLPDKKNAITLMTLHGAKGLEFKMVFLVGMEEGLLPHSQALFESGDVEEERRLCYVGITRAKEKLILTYAKRRLFFGQRTSNTKSRFIMELPAFVHESNAIDENTDDEPWFL